MIKSILARIQQKHRTMGYPDEPAQLPELFQGYPVLKGEKCPEGCSHCAAACPFDAIKLENRLSLDMGKCIFCRECSAACPEGAICFSNDHRLAANRRDDLIASAADGQRLAEALSGELLKLLGRSLKLREVSAAGCNACEADTNVLNTVGFDLGRFGIQFVASPRHADGIFITGPVSANMKEALLKTWEAIPEPKIAIACGSCAISGGPFHGSQQINNGCSDLIPIDLFIPGCPPHPLTILDGLLRLIGRV